MSDELTRNSRLQRIFKTLEGEGMDGKMVLKDILTIKPEELLTNKRAMDLLHEWLQPEELREFIEKGELTIDSKLHKGRKYKITRGRYDLTHVLEDGKHTQDLCVHAVNNDELPYGDSILTKIIALKANESDFLANSNVRQLIAQEYRPERHVQETTTRGMLVQRMHEIRLDRIGLVSTPPMPHSLPDALVQQCIRYVVAQAILDGVSHTEEGLVVRGILPDIDLLTTNSYSAGHWGSGGSGIVCPPYWRQPAEGTYTNTDNTKDFEAYKTNINCSNDRKAYILYGLMNLMPSERNVVSSITIRRGNLRIIDIIDTSHINQVDCIHFRTPILFKRSDDCTIMFGLNDEAKGRFSKIMLLGVVAEPLGTNVTG